jgi:alkylation response protein AidB-like acyl-CoA dehydrogenase
MLTTNTRTPTQCPAQYRVAVDLERHLGDPSDASGVFSFRRAVELDERDEYPEEACRLLDEWGLQAYYVPAEYGGRLATYEELLALVRAVSRRDVTVAVAHVKTYLGAVAVWVGGTAEQKRSVARTILRGEQVALALTERAHGSDILSSEVRAAPVDGGYLLSGEKWLVNNATRSTTLTVFARTEEGGGPRGCSLFLVEKKGLDESAYAHLPRVKTHGLRGADISGIDFKGARLPAEALVGARGSALELTLKGFQVTRSIVPALSLGAADTALRATLGFVLSRSLYGKPLFEIPKARKTLADAFIALLVGECVAVSTARALHAAPRQMSLLSAIAKYYVPTAVEKMVGNLSAVLGARGFLRAPHWSGIFQKILRDNAVASLFDGSTAVNLNAIALQLPDCAARRRKARSGDSPRQSASLESIFDLQKPLPPFDPEALELTCRGQNAILDGLDATVSRLSALKTGGGVSARVLEEIVALGGETLAARERFYDALDELIAGRRADCDKSAESFALARHYCVLHAAAACVQMWAYNMDTLPDFFSGGEWLAFSLHGLLATFDPSRALATHPFGEAVARECVSLYKGNCSFSIIPLRLPGGGRQSEEPITDEKPEP